MTQELTQRFFRSVRHSKVVTPIEEGIQSKNKSPSPELLSLIKGWTDTFLKSQELAKEIVAKAGEEGFSREEIRSLVEDVLRNRGLSDRRIFELLPFDLKNPSKMTKKPKILLRKTAAKDPVLPKQSNTSISATVQPPQGWEPLEDDHHEEREEEEEEEADPELEFLRDENQQLKQAIKQLQNFTPASQIITQGPQEDPEKPKLFIPEKDFPDINTVVFKCNVLDGKDYMKEQMDKFAQYVTRDFPQLKNSGWRWVEVTLRVIKK